MHLMQSINVAKRITKSIAKSKANRDMMATMAKVWNALPSEAWKIFTRH
jgi:hypothetical protein